MTKIIDLLADKIAKRQCILFLGPGVFKHAPEDQYTIYEKFSSELAAEIQQDGEFPFDASQQYNIYYTVPRYILFRNIDVDQENIADIRTKFKTFAAGGAANNSLYKDLARLSFPIVINSNPDYDLFHLVHGKKPAVTSYFDTSNKAVTPLVTRRALLPNDFDGSRTIFYNLFGSYEDNINSLVLTEDELLEYNVRLNHQETEIPSLLTSELDDNKYYVFLGFRYEEWMLKIILKALGLPKGKNKKITYTISDQPAPVYLRHFYEDLFKFIFIDQNNPHVFISELLKAGGGAAAGPVMKKKKIVFLLMAENPSDKDGLKLLNNHFIPLKEEGLIYPWSEEFLVGAEDIELSVKENLMDADIVVTLVSGEMMNDLINRIGWLENICSQRKQPPEIISVLLKAYDHTSVPFLKGYPWAPLSPDKKEVLAVTKWSNIDEAYKTVADQIKELLIK